jgi:quercetin dioxygenase-like cupin family protein
MGDFPAFMKRPANRIANTHQATPGVEGYIFDGADGSQMAFWTCQETAASAEHVHDYDEYMLVVEGCYTLLMNGQRVPVKAGEEYVIPRGVPHAGEVLAGTRTIHAFGEGGPDRRVGKPGRRPTAWYCWRRTSALRKAGPGVPRPCGNREGGQARLPVLRIPEFRRFQSLGHR